MELQLAQAMKSIEVAAKTWSPPQFSEYAERFLRHFVKYPRVAPDRFGPDPVSRPKYKYDPKTFLELFEKEGKGSNVWLLRKSPKIESLFSDVKNSGGHIMAYGTGLPTTDFNTVEVATYATDLTLMTKAEYGYAHTISHREFEYSGRRDFAGKTISGASYEYSLGSWSFPVGLLDQPWLTIFGPMYVRHFGRDRLLSAPAPIVKELQDGYILIQLSEDYWDIDNNWDRFHATRLAVMDHLGQDSYQQLIRPRTSEQAARFEPAKRVPPELMTIRANRLVELSKLHALQDAESARLPEVKSVIEMLADISRFKIVLLGSDLCIVDKARKEFIAFADDELREKWVSHLIIEGAEMEDEVRKLYEKAKSP